MGKHCRTVFQRSSTIYENCFDLIHSDVWTAPCLSRDDYKYYVTFIDEKSKYTWLTLIKTKDRVLDALKNFKAMLLAIIMPRLRFSGQIMVGNT